MTAPVLQLKGVGKQYRRGDEQVRVLVDFDFALEAGEFVVVTGPFCEQRARDEKPAAGPGVPLQIPTVIAQRHGLQLGDELRIPGLPPGSAHLGWTFPEFDRVEGINGGYVLLAPPGDIAASMLSSTGYQPGAPPMLGSRPRWVCTSTPSARGAAGSQLRACQGTAARDQSVAHRRRYEHHRQEQQPAADNTDEKNLSSNLPNPSRIIFIAERNSGRIDDEVLRSVLHGLGLEEATFKRDFPAACVPSIA